MVFMSILCITSTSISASYQRTAIPFKSNEIRQSQNSLLPRLVDDRITESDKYKSIAEDYMKIKQYHQAKLYLHEAINILKDSEGGCIDRDRVYVLKVMCQKAQTLINYDDWGFNLSDFKSMEILPVMVDQLHYLKIPGYENITVEALEYILSKAEDHVQLDKETFFSIYSRVFNDDGIDYAIDDHMGLFHAMISANVMRLADIAYTLNVNLVIFSHDTNEPIIIKQKNAIATLYIAMNIVMNDPDYNDFFKIESAYRDNNTTPNNSISNLVDKTPYSYERSLDGAKRQPGQPFRAQ